MIGIGIIGFFAMIGKTKLTFVNGAGLLIRGLTGAIAVFISFLSITKLGLIKASFIGQTFPIFATIFSVILLKEKIDPRKVLGLSISFIGLAIIMLGDHWQERGIFHLGIFELVAISGAIIGGFATVQVKQLHKTETTTAIFFAQCLMGFWLMAVPAASHHFSIPALSVVMLMLVGILATCGQMLFTVSIKHLNVATSSILIMFGPVLNAFLGILLFKEKITLAMTIGCVIMLGATMWVMMKSDLEEIIE
jgi:drug/metabolite transporter (DMT)-like permease